MSEITEKKKLNFKYLHYLKLFFQLASENLLKKI
jgi:hypothetical protein